MEKKYKTALSSLRTKWPEELDKIFPNPGKKTKWTKIEIVKVAKNCSHRDDMRIKHPQAYTIMNKSYPGLAEELFGKKTLGLNRNNRLKIR
jgi:hypothetical protein